MKTTFLVANFAALAVAIPFDWPWVRPTATITASSYVTPGAPTPTPFPGGPTPSYFSGGPATPTTGYCGGPPYVTTIILPPYVTTKKPWFGQKYTKTVSATWYTATVKPTPGNPYDICPTPTPSSVPGYEPPRPQPPKPKLCTLICSAEKISTCGPGWRSEKVGNCWSCCKDSGDHVDRRNMGRDLRVVW